MNEEPRNPGKISLTAHDGEMTSNESLARLPNPAGFALRSLLVRRRAAERSPGEPSLAAAEGRLLDTYLAALASGQRGSADLVDRLADVPFDGLRRIVEAYVALDEPVEPHTHRAFKRCSTARAAARSPRGRR